MDVQTTLRISYYKTSPCRRIFDYACWQSRSRITCRIPAIHETVETNPSWRRMEVSWQAWSTKSCYCTVRGEYCHNICVICMYSWASSMFPMFRDPRTVNTVLDSIPSIRKYHREVGNSSLNGATIIKSMPGPWVAFGTCTCSAACVMHVGNVRTRRLLERQPNGTIKHHWWYQRGWKAAAWTSPDLWHHHSSVWQSWRSIRCSSEIHITCGLDQHDVRTLHTYHSLTSITCLDSRIQSVLIIVVLRVHRWSIWLFRNIVWLYVTIAEQWSMKERERPSPGAALTTLTCIILQFWCRMHTFE